MSDDRLGKRTLSGPRSFRFLRFEWKPQDAWFGAFWDRRKWWAGFHDEEQQEALARGESVSAVPERLAHRTLDLWVCILPMVPLHYRRVTCPRPDLCGRNHPRD